MPPPKLFACIPLSRLRRDPQADHRQPQRGEPPQSTEGSATPRQARTPLDLPKSSQGALLRRTSQTRTDGGAKSALLAVLNPPAPAHTSDKSRVAELFALYGNAIQAAANLSEDDLQELSFNKTDLQRLLHTRCKLRKASREQRLPTPHAKVFFALHKGEDVLLSNQEIHSFADDFHALSTDYAESAADFRQINALMPSPSIDNIKSQLRMLCKAIKYDFLRGLLMRFPIQNLAQATLPEGQCKKMLAEFKKLHIVFDGFCAAKNAQDAHQVAHLGKVADNLRKQCTLAAHALREIQGTGVRAFTATDPQRSELNDPAQAARNRLTLAADICDSVSVKAGQLCDDISHHMGRIKPQSLPTRGEKAHV